MNAPTDPNWIETNRQALGGELNWLRHMLENAAHGGEDGVMAKPTTTAPILDFVAEQLQLSPFERALLLLCAGVEIESDFAHLCAVAQDDARCDYPTFGLALAVLPDAHWSSLSPQAPLRYWQMVNVNDTSHLSTSRLHIDERLLHFLLGIQALDQRLAGLVYTLAPAATLPPSHQRVVDRLCQSWHAAPGLLPVISLQGSDHSGARAVAVNASTQLGLHDLTLRADDLPHSVEERSLLVRLLTRECLLTRGAVIIEGDTDSAPHLAPVLEQLACPVMLLGRPPATLSRRCSVLTIDKPRHEEQHQLWCAALANGSAIDERILAPLTAQFSFSSADIAAASDEARLNTKDESTLDSALWNAARRHARGGLEQLAQRILPQATWEDLVLPAAQVAFLRDIARQIRHRATVYDSWGYATRGARGLGISALFAGESGTGKTLAAEVLAGALALDLYRIDLSAVVSKYIGETEKNLERLFSAAETSGAVLLFDEADALFGKRSEVKDSHDRYANIELAYLLQRMETYRGLSILTTNLKSSLDTAFLRRIRFVVQFPFPDATQRAHIWRGIFPDALPRNDLNTEQLARLHVAGGNIRNIALNAAFLAAEDGGPLSMSHLARAARMEYAKLEKPFNEAEIGAWR